MAVMSALVPILLILAPTCRRLTGPLVAELAKLARILVAYGIRLIALLARSRGVLATENLFLRKQLTVYQERKIRPPKLRGLWWCCLLKVSHGGMHWCMSLLRPLSDGTEREFACSGAGSLDQGLHAHRTQAIDP